MFDSYVSLDLETTGLNPKTDKILEIGAVKVVEGSVTDTYSTVVNPHRQLSEKVREITGITQQEADGGRELAAVLPGLLEFIGDMDLLGHSLMFDYAFVKKAAVNAGLAFEKKGVDTLKLARRYLADTESKKLASLCTYYGIEHQAHRALGDARATHDLYRKLVESFYEPENFEPVPLIYKVKKEGPASKRQKERLYQLIGQHKIMAAIDVESLTKNEASRFTDQILSGAVR